MLRHMDAIDAWRLKSHEQPKDQPGGGVNGADQWVGAWNTVNRRQTGQAGY